MWTCELHARKEHEPARRNQRKHNKLQKKAIGTEFLKTGDENLSAEGPLGEASRR